MNNTIHKFDANLKRLIDEIGYKHIALESQEGERIVTYNPAKTKIINKWDEIRKRLMAQPDGFYKILATTALGGKAKPDIYIIQKGNPPKENLQEDKTPKQEIIVKSKTESQREEVLSLPEALKRIEELSTLRVENVNLKEKVKELEEYVSELETDLEEAESKPLDENNGTNNLASWAEKTLPSVTPFIDEYFKMQNRKMDLQEKMLSRKEKKPPIVIKTNRRRVNQQEELSFMNMDLNNEEQLNQLFDEMDALTDDKFNEMYDYISEQRPELADIIADEFQLESEEEEQL